MSEKHAFSKWQFSQLIAELIWWWDCTRCSWRKFQYAFHLRPPTQSVALTSTWLRTLCVAHRPGFVCISSRKKPVSVFIIMFVWNWPNSLGFWPILNWTNFRQFNFPLSAGYAARAFSSIDVENVHSILNHLDRRGAPNCSIDELSRHVSNLQRLQILRKTSVGRLFMKISGWSSFLQWGFKRGSLQKSVQHWDV